MFCVSEDGSALKCSFLWSGCIDQCFNRSVCNVHAQFKEKTLSVSHSRQWFRSINDAGRAASEMWNSGLLHLRINIKTSHSETRLCHVDAIDKLLLFVRNVRKQVRDRMPTVSFTVDDIFYPARHCTRYVNRNIIYSLSPFLPNIVNVLVNDLDL